MVVEEENEWMNELDKSSQQRGFFEKADNTGFHGQGKSTLNSICVKCYDLLATTALTTSI